MSNYGKKVDSVYLGQSYNDKRRISGHRKVQQRNFKDKSKKIIAVLLAAGTLLVGANHLINNRQRSERLDVVDKFSSPITQTYEGSEYLQTSFRQEDYYEYCEETLNDTFKSENELVEYLSNEDFDENTWLYILIGEGNRLEISDEKIIEELARFEPYSAENIKYDEKGMPKEYVSYFAQLAINCSSESSEKDLILLIDGIVGRTSISNSKDALYHDNEKIEEIHRHIKWQDKTDLKRNISINNTFEENVKEDRSYLQPYIEKVYNPRIETAQEIAEGKILTNVRNPELLKKFTRSLTYRSIISNPGAVANNGIFEINPKVADEKEYETIRNTRNALYEYCIYAIDNPEVANKELEAISENLENRLESYIMVKEMDEDFLKQLLGITQQNQQKHTNTRHSGEFSR